MPAFSNVLYYVEKPHFTPLNSIGFLECNIMFTMNVEMLAPRNGGYTICFAFSHSNASEAKRFCLEHECPSNWNNANEDNCCVYHANIHSCPLALMVSIVMVGVNPTASTLWFSHTGAEIFAKNSRINMAYFGISEATKWEYCSMWANYHCQKCPVVVCMHEKVQ